VIGSSTRFWTQSTPLAAAGAGYRAPTLGVTNKQEWLVQRVSFNDGWSFRPKVSFFLEFVGQTKPWTPVCLPHDALIGERRDPASGWGVGYFPSGTWEYRKSFVVPEHDRGKRIFLEFEGVYRDGTVWVNGSFAAHRPFGYANFAVPIDHLVRHGEENEIRVEVTAQDDARWYSGAGVYRNVKLIVGELVHLALDSLFVTTPEIDDALAVVEVTTILENDGAVTTATTVTTEVVDDTGAVVARDVSPVTAFPREAQKVSQRLYVPDPRRWSVETPTLYTCRVVVRDPDGAEIDEDTTTFGIRSLQLDPVRGLRINGEVVNLRGACIHHDNGVIGAATIARADERRVELLKAAGFNAIRSAHNPASKALLDACDHVGMLVMDEAFDMWTAPKMQNDYARTFPEWWHADLDAMVLKDRNHPSVILYSLGNEIPDTGNPAGAARGRTMAERIRSLDDTRYITNGINAILAVGIDAFRKAAAEAMTAANSTDAPDEGTGVNTFMAQMAQVLPRVMQSDLVGKTLAEPYAYLDVAGYNYADSRYASDHDQFPNRVIVGSETRPEQIAHLWRLVEQLPHVIGDFTWTGWDYLGEVGIGRTEYDVTPGAEGTSTSSAFFGAYPWLTAWCGDLDITGQRRPMSYFRETVYGLRDEPYTVVQPPDRHGRTPAYSAGPLWNEGVSSWSWPGFEGRPVTVDVFSDADEVELFVNGSSVGRRPVGDEHGFHASFETTFEPGEIVAVAYRDAAEVARAALQSATGPARLELLADHAVIRADDTDLAYVDIALVDESGRLYHTDDRAVTVDIEGPAVLQALGSGNPRTEETFGRTTHDTFRGRALAVVRPTAPGTIMVTVTADGCAPQTLTLDARPS
jgi:beta-galactosidase